MKVPATAIAATALLASLACAAEPADEAFARLQRAAASARETTYAGTVMHVQGERTATSRITHHFIGGSEHERIESLDGPRHEIVRRDDNFQCFFPDAKTVHIDRRVSARFFPSLVSGPVEAIGENYRIALGKVMRLLGQDCQWIHLDPLDGLRYAQRLCAEVGSGLILRAKTLGAKHQVLEQYSFTDLRLGRAVSREELKSTYQPQSKSWKRDVLSAERSMPDPSGWIVASPPPGFRLVGERQRVLPQRRMPVTQIVLSDGLATMSVFVEPLSGDSPRGAGEAANEDGSLSVFVRPMGEHVVTVLGEVPPETAKQVGRSVARRAGNDGGAAR